WAAITAPCAAAAEQNPPPLLGASQFRRPVAAAFLGDGHTLCVANRSNFSSSAGSLASHRLSSTVKSRSISFNRCLAVVCLFNAQRLAFSPIDRQRFERTDFTTTHDGLDHG